jgi:ribonuclease R
MTERRADDATRDVADALKCEYMQDHVGDEMTGTIAAVTNFGFFVRLNDIQIDGLVHVTSLISDYYIFDAGRQTLKGERTGRTYRIGDVLQVKVLSVNLDDKKIDFELADEADAGSRKRAKPSHEKGKIERAMDKRRKKRDHKTSNRHEEQPIIKAINEETEKQLASKKPAKKKHKIKQGEKNTASSKKKKTTAKKARPGRAARKKAKAN